MFKFNLVCFILILPVLISCSSTEPPSHEIDLLSETWNDVTERNFRMVNNIHSEVEEMGRRGADVEVLNKAQGILKKRETLQIPLPEKREIELESFSQLTSYLNYLDSLNNNDNYSSYDEYDWESRVMAIKHFQSLQKGEFDLKYAHNILVNLAYLERSLLQNLAVQVGASHDFGISFARSTRYDTIKLGELFELILMPTEADSNLVLEYHYDSAEISHEGAPFTDFDLKVIGSAAYLKFTPEEPGVYKFSSNFRAVFHHGEYDYKWPVWQEIVVVR